MILIENCLLHDFIFDSSVWLKTSSNTADINRFRSHTGKYFTIFALLFVAVYKKNLQSENNSEIKKSFLK